MSQDHWKALKAYEAQQRQAQTENAQRLSEKQVQQKKDETERQTLREQERRTTEHHQALQRQIEHQQAEEKQRQAEQVQASLLAQSAEELRAANQQMREAYLTAAQKLQEAQQIMRAGSPIEIAFFAEWSTTYPAIKLERQHHIGKYRVDFAHVETKLAIELDGHVFHSRRADRNRDYRRQREIEDLGWRFVRFTGSEVHCDVAGCVQTVWERIQAW